MKRRYWVWMAPIVACLALTAWAEETPEDAAQAAAESWLKLVDAAKYGESYDQAAKVFKDAVTKEQWTEASVEARTPLGKVVSRKLKSRAYTKELPGAPEGEYVIVQYNTEFENGTTIVETVTPMLEPDGAWRVTGYFHQ